MHIAWPFPTITEGFQPSQNSTGVFSLFRYSFMLYFSYKIGSCFAFFHVECAVWQYGLWSFQTGGTKLERFSHKNQHTLRKLLNFENWISGGLTNE
jgi:hypothetical protein